MAELLRLHQVSKRFGDTIALHPTSLSVEGGTTVALLGPSGCGKSTLLRLVIRLLQPDSGRIHFDGSEVGQANVSELRRRTGYVIQEGGLFPHLTTRQNIALMARNLRQPAAEIGQRIDELCALTRFPPEGLHRYPGELSGGQRQRVSLMRALMLSPQLLLLDEPLGALDPMVRAQLQRELKEIFAQLGQTTILVTHDLHEAAFLARRIVLMNEGRVVQEGTIEELRERPAIPFVKEFLEAQLPLTA